MIAALLLVSVTTAAAPGQGSVEPFSEIVELSESDTSPVWRRELRGGGFPKSLEVILRRLIAVEGGTVAYELLVSESQSDTNLLGERPEWDHECACFPEVPSVLSVEHLKPGAVSRYGRVREFPLPGGAGTLRLELLTLELGHGVAYCTSCPSIERIRVQITVEGRAAPPNEEMQQTKPAVLSDSAGFAADLRC